VRPQADGEAASDPFAALLAAVDVAATPDVAVALTAQVEIPGVDAVVPTAKANPKIDLPAVPAGKDAPQAQAELMLAIAATTGRSSAPEGKKPDTPAPAKTSPGESAPAEVQPDAKVAAPPKQADAPDDVEADVAAAMPTVPAAVPVVPVPAPAPSITGALSAESTETAKAIASVSADVKSAPAPDVAIPVMAAQAEPVEPNPSGRADKAADAKQPEAESEKHAGATTTDEPAPETETVAQKPAKSAALADSTPAKSKADAGTENQPDHAVDLPAKALQLDGDTQKAKAPAPAPAADATTNANANALANAPALPAPAMTHSVASHGVPQAAHLSTTADAVSIAGVAVEIAAHARDGKNHFEIRLDPPELGRIDVRLHIDHDGQVTSHLRVDRTETLDLLRRDAPALEKALQDAGLKTADSGLQFSLRHQNSSQQNQGHEPPPTSARLVLPDEASATAETRRHYGRLAGLGGGVDITV
jgi:flagellar hook-length control protein FliK